MPIPQPECVHLIAEVLEKPATNLKMSMSLTDNGWDSLSSITLLSIVDERFDGEIEPDEVVLEEPLAALCETLSSRLSPRQSVAKITQSNSGSADPDVDFRSVQQDLPTVDDGTDVLLRGKSVMVTGGSSGIGLEVVRRLDRAGVNIVMVGRNLDRLNDVLSGLRGKGHRSVVLDVSDPTKFEDAFSAVADSIPILDGLVLCAGKHFFSPIQSIDIEQHRQLMAINVDGSLFCIKTVRALGLLKSPASIVLMSSVVASKGQASAVSYAASKGAVSAMTRSLARELAAENIRVNSIAPGVVDTPMTKSWSRILPTDVLNRMESEYPLGVGRVADIASVVEFLLSPLSKWITGSELIVDGGYLA